MTLRVGSMSFDGDGVARHGGHTLLVPGTVTGDVVEARLSAAPESRVQVTEVRVTVPSPHRVVERCAHASECGGCTWQHVAYAEQLDIKRRHVEALLRRDLGEPTPRVARVIGADPAWFDGTGMPWGFRHKASFAVGQGDSGRRLSLGHYSRGTRQVVGVRECPVHAETGNRLAFAARDALTRYGVEACDERLRGGPLRHLVVRVSRATGRAALVLVVTDPHHRRLRSALRDLESIADPPETLCLNVNPQPGPYLFGRETIVVSGEPRIAERVGDETFLISPTAFFQTNIGAAEVLSRLVLDAVPATARRVLDLYAGCGLFSQPLARRGLDVVAVEEHAQAIADGVASRDAAGLSSSRYRFVRARVERFLHRDRAAMQALRQDVDAVILDPPREGCPPGVLETVMDEVRAAVIVYVSCAPASLARDLGRARTSARQAYGIGPVQPVDMFPHTPHVETVVVMHRLDRAASAGGPRRRTPR